MQASGIAGGFPRRIIARCAGHRLSVGAEPGANPEGGDCSHRHVVHRVAYNYVYKLRQSCDRRHRTCVLAAAPKAPTGLPLQFLMVEVLGYVLETSTLAA